MEFVALLFMIAGAIIQFAVLLLMLVIAYKIVWYIVSGVWQEIHKGSHDWVIYKVKGIFSKKIKSKK